MDVIVFIDNGEFDDHRHYYRMKTGTKMINNKVQGYQNDNKLRDDRTTTN